MKSLTRGHLKAGLDSVRGAKLRNFWTMLGVIVGVASVITIVALSEGIKQQIGAQLHQFGKGLITVQPTEVKDGSYNNPSLGLLSGFSLTSSLTPQDLQAVSQTQGVAAAAPLSLIPGTIRGDHGRYTNGLVVGTTNSLSSLLNQSLAYGAFWSNDDADSNVAVIGLQAAEQMFNEDVPLGRSFSFRGQQFIVRGIFNDFNAAPLSEEANFNNDIFIPYDTAESLTSNSALTYEILARPANPHQPDSVISNIEHRLNTLHGGISTTSVLKQSQAIANSNAVLDLLTHLITGVAAISLLVGGIGIMNVMLVSVAERTHEVGIRKAVGATNSQILSQFMIEATALSLVGGISGIILAYLIEVSVRLATTLTPIISWQVVLLATGVSLSIGVIFGSIPALKAARKDPIEALRSE